MELTKQDGPTTRDGCPNCDKQMIRIPEKNGAKWVCWTCGTGIQAGQETLSVQGNTPTQSQLSQTPVPQVIINVGESSSKLSNKDEVLSLLEKNGYRQSVMDFISKKLDDLSDDEVGQTLQKFQVLSLEEDIKKTSDQRTNFLIDSLVKELLKYDPETEDDETKEAGMAAGGSAATSASTGFTPTFGGESANKRSDSLKTNEEERKEQLEKAGINLTENHDTDHKGDKVDIKNSTDKCLCHTAEDSQIEGCLSGWGDCKGCTPEICKAHDKWIGFNTIELIKSKEGDVYIAGYASPHVIDDEGHRIEKTALRPALHKFMFNPAFRNVMIVHTGIQVGEVVLTATDSAGKTYKTQVDDKGLYTVCKLRKDIQVGQEVITAIEKGELNSFSIRGRGLQREFKCEDGRCFWSITELELYEVTICKRGVNPDATFILLKSKDSPTLLKGVIGASEDDLQKAVAEAIFGSTSPPPTTAFVLNDVKVPLKLEEVNDQEHEEGPIDIDE